MPFKNIFLGIITKGTLNRKLNERDKLKHSLTLPWVPRHFPEVTEEILKKMDLSEILRAHMP